MGTFRDTLGRPWQIEINVTTLRRVKALVNVNLLEVLEAKGTLLGRLMFDPFLLCDVLFAICKPEADAAGVSDEDFGKGLAGDVLDAAFKALEEQIISFCQNPTDRANLRKAMEIAGGAMQQARELATEKLNRIDPKAIVEQALASLSDGSGSSPASSG